MALACVKKAFDMISSTGVILLKSLYLSLMLPYVVISALFISENRWKFSLSAILITALLILTIGFKATIYSMLFLVHFIIFTIAFIGFVLNSPNWLNNFFKI
jgi:hypothetical protein